MRHVLVHQQHPPGRWPDENPGAGAWIEHQIDKIGRELDVDIALQWDEGYDATTRSFVNVIATSQGGTHVAGFERALVKVVNDQLKKARILKSSEASVTKDDIIEGLTAVVTVRLAEPQFEGQTKEVLGTPAERMMARDALSSLLSSVASSSPRAYAAHLLRRLRTADPQSHSHVVSLMALARVARETPTALAPHVPALMDAVLFSLQPSNASLRRNCLVGSTALVR